MSENREVEVDHKVSSQRKQIHKDLESLKSEIVGCTRYNQLDQDQVLKLDGSVKQFQRRIVQQGMYLQLNAQCESKF